MVLSIGERTKGLFVSPSKTFDDSKEDSLGSAFRYFIVVLAIFAVLIAIVAAVAFSMLMGNLKALDVPTRPLEAFTGPSLAALVFAFVLVGGAIGVFIAGLWTHIWVYLVGGRKGVGQTIKGLMYGLTPGCLLGWIPIVDIGGAIWALIDWIIGVRQLHELSTGKAVLSVIIAIAIPAVIIGVVFVACMSL
jgi:hypothetical protein